MGIGEISKIPRVIWVGFSCTAAPPSVGPISEILLGQIAGLSRQYFGGMPPLAGIFSELYLRLSDISLADHDVCAARELLHPAAVLREIWSLSFVPRTLVVRQGAHRVLVEGHPTCCGQRRDQELRQGGA